MECFQSKIMFSIASPFVPSSFVLAPFVLAPFVLAPFASVNFILPCSQASRYANVHAKEAAELANRFCVFIWSIR